MLPISVLEVLARDPWAWLQQQWRDMIEQAKNRIVLAAEGCRKGPRTVPSPGTRAGSGWC